MVGLEAPTRGWLRAVADHITEFSLGGMRRVAGHRRRAGAARGRR